MVCKALKGPVSRVFQRGVNLFYYVPLRQAVRPLASEVRQCHREPSVAALAIHSCMVRKNKGSMYELFLHLKKLGQLIRFN